MKKLIALVLCLTVVLSLAACTAKTEAEPETEPAATEEPVGMANPMTEVTPEELQLQVGLNVFPIEGATDVKCYTVDGAEFDKMAEMDFTYDGKAYCYRAARTGELETFDMSGLYFDWKEQSQEEFGIFTAEYRAADAVSVLYWLDIVPGVNYTISSQDGASKEELLAMAELLYVPTQGEVDGDDVGMDFPQIEYTGSYTDADFDTVEMVKNEDNTYSVKIGITRLAEFEGTGNIEDGAVYFTVTDPNGGDVVGVFHPAENDTFTLKFIQSTWNLLEEGTTFEGFTVNAQ